MNKKLIAIAIAGAMSAPFAANASEATIYGVMDMSIDRHDNGDTGNDNDSATGVSSNSSRIGLKGAEDLGGGMKAIWQVESQINVGNGTTEWGGRNTFAGLAGSFGTFILGKHDTPLKTTGRKAELFGNSVADTRNIIRPDNAHMDLRPDNVAAYITPNMGGFNAVIAYVTDVAAGGDDANDDGFGDTNGDNTSPMNENNAVDAYSISLNYSAGPLFVSAATTEINASDLNGLNGNGITGTEDHQTNRVAATYKMGAAKVAGLWQEADFTDGDSNSAWGLGGAYTMGNNTIKAQYYVADDMDDTDDSGADMFAIGLDHAMSKQTKLYAVYADMSNDDNAAYALGPGTGHGDNGPSGGPATGEDASAFSVGMQHKF